MKKIQGRPEEKFFKGGGGAVSNLLIIVDVYFANYQSLFFAPSLYSMNFINFS